MAREQRLEAELQEASKHLHYEVQMLHAVAVASGLFGSGPITNALVESFAIHVRNLIDFFYLKEPRQDDLIAEDFFADAAQWRSVRPNLSADLDQAKKRAHKEIAHLTYARLDVTPEAKLWQFVHILNEISKVLSEWPPGEPEAAAWRCPHCAELVHERHKARMVQRGRWRAQAEGAPGHAGFKINSLVSLLPNAAWGKLAAEFLHAKDDSDHLKVFVNTVLGEPWREAADEVDQSELASIARCALVTTTQHRR